SNAHRFSAGVAPLEETGFNNFKSDIKFLEYSMMGLPGLYSDYGAYRAAVKNGATGILVPNTIEGWRQAVLLAAREQSRMKEIADTAHEYVRSSRMIGNSVEDYRNLLFNLIDARSSRTCSKQDARSNCCSVVTFGDGIENRRLLNAN